MHSKDKLVDIAAKARRLGELLDSGSEHPGLVGFLHRVDQDLEVAVEQLSRPAPEALAS